MSLSIFKHGLYYLKYKSHEWCFSLNEGGDLRLPNLFMSFKYYIIPTGFYLYLPTKNRFSWFWR